MGAIYEAFTAFINTHATHTWSQEVVGTLLYLIARDNEMGHLAGEVARDSDRLISLSGAAAGSNEPDARWQLAAELGRLESHRVVVEPLLVQFAHDEDEYVRRQALMALGTLGSPLVEDLAEAAWRTGHEYQRMAVLAALRDVQSPALDEYLARAESDGRQYLLHYAAKIRAGVAD